MTPFPFMLLTMMAISPSAAQSPKTPQQMYEYALRVNECKTERYGWGYMMNAARKDYPPAMYEWGKCYIRSEVEAQRKTAFGYVKKAAEKQHVPAYLLIADAYANGYGTPANRDEALKWYRAAVAAGSRNALMEMGNVLARPPASAADLNEARGLYQRAADAGDLDALYNIALTYHASDPERLRLLEIAAAKGSKAAKDNLEFQRNNHVRALGVSALKAKADGGDVAAMKEIAAYHRSGRAGVAVDPAQSLVWYTRAAAAGDAESMREAGAMHEKGFGTKANPNEALRLYLASSKAGDLLAPSLAGMLLASGAGGSKDLAEARRLYQLGAERGDLNGLWNMALTYELGSDERLYWAELAAEKGQRDAKARIELERKAGDDLRTAAAERASEAREAARLAPYRKGIPKGWMDVEIGGYYFWTPATISYTPGAANELFTDRYSGFSTAPQAGIWFQKVRTPGPNGVTDVIRSDRFNCVKAPQCKFDKRPAIPGVVDATALTRIDDGVRKRAAFLSDGKTAWMLEVSGRDHDDVFKIMLNSLRVMDKSQ